LSSAEFQRLPRVLAPGPGGAVTSLFVALRRRFRHATGRELGLAHATRLLARYLPSWQELPLEGPAGRSVYLDLRDSEGYLVNGFESTVGHMSSLIAQVHDGDVLLDVGANIGVWSRELLAHRQLGAVYAFEAAACAFRMLQKNLASYPNVRCENVAVGAENGVAKFRDDIGGQNRVISELHNEHEPNAGHTVTVPIVTLDTWAERVGLTRLDVMKVDVEGGELDVFRGAERTLRRFFPVIYFEYLPETGAVGAAKTQAFEWLTELGYKMQAVLSDGRSVPVATPGACAQLATYSNDVIALPPK